MSDCADNSEGSRAHVSGNETPMLSPLSYRGSRSSGSSKPCSASLQSKLKSPPISADVNPCLPPEEEMSTVHNPLQNQLPITSEILRYSQRDGDNDNENRHIGPGISLPPSFPPPSFPSPSFPPAISTPSFPSSSNWPNPKLLQNPHRPDREMEVVQEAMTEGLIKYGLPLSAAAVAGTFLMRRRYRQFKATPVESFLLSALHYYGALSLGLYTGLTLYTPQFEAKIKEKIPDSSVARALKENRDRYK